MVISKLSWKKENSCKIPPSVKVAQVTKSFTFEDADHVLKMIKIILREAKQSNVELISFPELFLNSKESHVDDTLFAAIENSAKENRVNCVLRYLEHASDGGMFSSQCIINAHGEMISKRRKLCISQDQADFKSLPITVEDVEKMAVNLPFSVGMVKIGSLLGNEILHPLLVHLNAAKSVKVLLSSLDDGIKTPVINPSYIMAGISQQIGSYTLLTCPSIEDYSKAWLPHGGILSAELTTKYLSIYSVDLDKIAFLKNLIDIVGSDSRPSLLSVVLDH